MKKIINKTVLAVILALSMVLAMLGGLLFVRHNGVAEAVSTTSVKFTTDKSSVFPGGTFQLTMTIETPYTGNTYDAIELNMGVIASDGSIDATNSKLFTLSNIDVNVTTNKNKGKDGRPNVASYTDTSSKQSNGTYSLSISRASTGTGFDAAEAFVLTATVSVDGTVTKDVTYTFGVRAVKANYVDTKGATTTNDALNTSKATITNASILVKEASNNSNLKAPLKVGQGDTLGNDDIVTLPSDPATPIAITVTDPSLPLSVLPLTDDEGATVLLKPGDIAVKSGEIGKVTIPADGSVTIEVTAENGTNKTTYTIQVTVKGAALTNLVVANDTQKTGLTKNNLDLTATGNAFDPAVEAYTVYVPNDSTKIDITATVDSSHGGSNVVDLTKSGSFTADSTATSGTKFSLTNVKDVIEDDDTLSIICKDSDGNPTKTYVLTFDVVDVDTSLSAVTVVGTNTHKTFNNSEVKATENGVDYYFMVIGESNASSTVTVTATSAEATVSLSGTTNKKTVSKTALTANTYTVTVLAEAGNTQDYQLTLKNQQVLKLKSTATIDFIYSKDVEEDGDIYNYIESYKTASMTHGLDDINFKKVVIGKVAFKTSAKDFLANFDSTQSAQIRLVDSADDVVCFGGTPGEYYEADDLENGDDYAVGTGWYVELVIGGNVEDRIYISVLGDIDGDGKVGAYDITLLCSYIDGTDKSPMDEMEVFLAALVTNYGTISARDIAEMVRGFLGQSTISGIFTSF